MKRAAWSCLVIGALVLSGCGSEDSPGDPDPTSSGEPQQGGELNVGLIAFPEPLDPLKIFSSYGRVVAAAIYDTLLTIDDEGELQPYLATDYSTPDDGQTWVITLNDGVGFQDGTPLDAAAVVAHVDRLKDPANECTCAGDIATVTSAEATGDLEVTFSLSAPKASFPSLLAGELGMIAAPDSTPEAPIGAGPFELTESRQDESITVTAWDGYWQEGKPYLDSVVYTIIPDVDTRVAAIQSGELDAFNSLPYERWPDIEAEDNLQLIQYSGLGSVTILMNMATAPFDNPDARIAAAKALDLETLHATLNAGQTEPATSIFNRGTWSYPGEIEDYPTYDLEGAKELVDDLGGLSFTVLVPGPTYYDQAIAAQGMWAEAGITVEVEQGDANGIVAQYREGNYEAAFTSYSGRIDPQVFASRYGSESSGNYSNLQVPDIDELIAEADATIDREARAAIYAEIAQLTAEILPFIIVNNLNDAFIATTEVQGIAPSPDGVLRPANVWLDANS